MRDEVKVAGNMPAFPQNEFSAYTTDREGMSLRDWFAGQALAGFTVATNSNIEPERYAEACFKLADAMIAARSEPTGDQKMQHVAYFDDGEFHWMSGIKPRDCELYAARSAQP